jgi:hypothetical protein
MSAMTPISKDAPVMKAWNAHKNSDDFANSKKWAVYPEHVDGSLWATFYAGYFACAVAQSAAPTEPADTQIEGTQAQASVALSAEPLSAGRPAALSAAPTDFTQGAWTKLDESSTPTYKWTPTPTGDTPPVGTAMLKDIFDGICEKASRADDLERRLQASEAAWERAEQELADLRRNSTDAIAEHFHEAHRWRDRAEKAEAELAALKNGTIIMWEWDAAELGISFTVGKTTHYAIPLKVHPALAARILKAKEPK